MTEQANEILRELDTLLDVERQALLDGEFDTLAGIVEKKEDLIEALNASELDQPEGLAPVNDKVVRNQALLEQALQGIRSVAKKLGEIRQAKKAFDIYDRLGQKNRIEAEADASVEKRA